MCQRVCYIGYVHCSAGINVLNNNVNVKWHGSQPNSHLVDSCIIHASTERTEGVRKRLMAIS